MPNRALLIGINDYQGISDLNGCVNDVWNMRDLLIETFGYAPEDISLLVDSSVTKERIRSRVNWLFAGAEKGDNLVFHFSGHGSYIRDFDGDEANRQLRDNADELICLYGMDWRNPDTYIVDDDLRLMFGDLPPGPALKVILDSCHSGTGTRESFGPPAHLSPGSHRGEAFTVNVYGGTTVLSPHNGTASDRNNSPGPPWGGGWGGSSGPPWGGGWSTDDVSGEEGRIQRPRFMMPPADIFARSTYLGRNARSHLGRPAGESMNHVLLAGCRDDQTSADARIGGAYNGAFTYYFADAIRQLGADTELMTLVSKVRHSLRRGGFTQVPQLEGASTGQTFHE